MLDDIQKYDGEDKPNTNTPKKWYKDLGQPYFIFLTAIFLFGSGMYAAVGLLDRKPTIIVTAITLTIFILYQFFKHQDKFNKPVHGIGIGILLAGFFVYSYHLYTIPQIEKPKTEVQQIEKKDSIRFNPKNDTIASKTVFTHPSKALIRKSNIPKNIVAPISEHYDIHPENQQGGIVIGKNTATIFQNPAVTIDVNGISVDSNAIVQDQKFVAKGIEPRFNLKDSTIIFSQITHNGSFKANLDFRYRGNTLRMKSDQGAGIVEFGGQTYITIYNPVCDYSGTINGIKR
jgi:hypothetical protein